MVNSNGSLWIGKSPDKIPNQEKQEQIPSKNLPLEQKIEEVAKKELQVLKTTIFTKPTRFSFENNKKTIPVIREKIIRLPDLRKQMRLGELDRDSFDEEIFSCAKELYFLKLATPEKKSRLKKEIKAWEDQLHMLSLDFPKIDAIVENFGEKYLDMNFEQMIKTLWNDYQSNSNLDGDLSKDEKVFNSETYSKARALRKTIETGFPFPLVATIEQLWKTGQHEPFIIKIQSHDVIFIPPHFGVDKMDIFIQEKYLDKGNFKIVYTASSFFDVIKESQRKSMVLIRSLEDVQEARQQEMDMKSKASKMKAAQVETEIEESDGTKSKKDSTENTLEVNPGTTEMRDESEKESDEDSGTTKQKSSENFITESMRKISYSNENVVLKKNLLSGRNNHITSKDVVDDPLKSLSMMEKEIVIREKFKGLPGIWQDLRPPIKINNQFFFVQPLAGYPLTVLDLEGNGKIQKNVIDLQKMVELLNSAEMTKKQWISIDDQINYLEMIEQFLKGVQGIHGLGYIHRDLKPENILCSKEFAGLTDFGTVCLDKNEQNKHCLAKGKFTATPIYVAPETALLYKVFREQNRTNVELSEKDWLNISPAVDIWAVGLILYRLLSGNPLQNHPAKGRTDLLGVIARGNLLFNPNSYVYEKPPNDKSLAYLVWECTQLDPLKRPNISKVLNEYHDWKEKTVKKLKSLEEGSISQKDAQLNIQQTLRKSKNLRAQMDSASKEIVEKLKNIKKDNVDPKGLIGRKKIMTMQEARLSAEITLKKSKDLRVKIDQEKEKINQSLKNFENDSVVKSSSKIRALSKKVKNLRLQEAKFVAEQTLSKAQNLRDKLAENIIIPKEILSEYKDWEKKVIDELVKLKLTSTKDAHQRILNQIFEEHKIWKKMVDDEIDKSYNNNNVIDLEHVDSKEIEKLFDRNILIPCLNYFNE